VIRIAFAAPRQITLVSVVPLQQQALKFLFSGWGVDSLLWRTHEKDFNPAVEVPSFEQRRSAAEAVEYMKPTARVKLVPYPKTALWQSHHARASFVNFQHFRVHGRCKLRCLWIDPGFLARNNDHLLPASSKFLLGTWALSE